jgi:small-conductance mechanosensitive channel
MSETFTFNVNYSTTFEDLEKLRTRMLAFVESERRDYQPIFDVKVNGKYLRALNHFMSPDSLRSADFPEQSKMTLSADIKYKSNFQQAALRGACCKTYSSLFTIKKKKKLHTHEFFPKVNAETNGSAH